MQNACWDISQSKIREEISSGSWLNRDLNRKSSFTKPNVLDWQSYADNEQGSVLQHKDLNFGQYQKEQNKKD